LYPALNVLFVFFVPLLVTLNYYDLLFGLVGRIKPDTAQTTRETISFIVLYLVTFFICVYFCLWLCAEDLRVGRTIDTIAGGILGAMTGAICCGVLMMFWFSMPFSRSPRVEVNDADMFYKPQVFALQAAEVVADRIKEDDRAFSGERFLRDLRYGLPHVPAAGGGIYVSSVPAGLQVFISPGGLSPEIFLSRIEDRLANPDKDIPPSEQRNAVIEKGRTPLWLEGVGGNALVAVVMDNVPSEFAMGPSDKPDMLFADDGEIGYARTTVVDRVVYIKFYRMGATGPVPSEIALFQPQDMAKYRDAFEEFWPAKACFRFNDGDMAQLLKTWVSPEEAKNLVGKADWNAQLRMCGKATFKGTDGKDYAVELSAPAQPPRVFEVPAPPDLSALPRSTMPR
jgi:hypothetical protein